MGIWFIDHSISYSIEKLIEIAELIKEFIILETGKDTVKKKIIVIRVS